MSRSDFKDLMFYEIYPTSFMDSNNDGIGDLKGIESKLTYVKDLGFNAIWLNPIFKSPFYDGGYDVADFFDVDPKFGTLDDFKSLIKKAHELGIKIILDLVAGHASIQNPDFIKSGEQERNDKSDLFVWNNSVWEFDPRFRFISGMFQRNAAFMVNFFAIQPAFNFGFYTVDKDWQMSYTDKRTYQARDYMINVMRHWLSLGADGFRVDMADSLVKNDPDKKGTIEVWKYMFSIIRKEFPNAYFVSEWSNPYLSFEAGFDGDFVLDAWDHFYHRMVRSNENTRGVSAFNGNNDMEFIIHDMKWRFSEAKKHNAYLAMISGNHDSPRLANSVDDDKAKMYYLFQFTMPGTPFVYYGDELMMKTSDIPSKDGGFQRTGTRTPMIWNDELPYHGFSKTKGEIYLPFYDENKVSAEDAIKDKNSVYNFLKKLTQIRNQYTELQSLDVDISEKDRVITLDRGNGLKVIMNLTSNPCTIKGEVIISSKEMMEDQLPPFSAVLIKE